MIVLTATLMIVPRGGISCCSAAPKPHLEHLGHITQVERVMALGRRRQELARNPQRHHVRDLATVLFGTFEVTHTQFPMAIQFGTCRHNSFVPFGPPSLLLALLCGPKWQSLPSAVLLSKLLKQLSALSTPQCWAPVILPQWTYIAGSYA
eukprot:1160026-Pelagomonas_calceolata.AAC.23